MAPAGVPCDRKALIWKMLLCIAKDGVVPAFASFITQFDHDMLDLGVFVKGIHGHVFAYAALFVAAMGHLRGQRQVIGDPYCTKLQHLAGSHSPENVGSADKGSQAVDPTVGFSP